MDQIDQFFHSRSFSEKYECPFLLFKGLLCPEKLTVLRLYEWQAGGVLSSDETRDFVIRQGFTDTKNVDQFIMAAFVRDTFYLYGDNRCMMVFPFGDMFVYYLSKPVVNRVAKAADVPTYRPIPRSQKAIHKEAKRPPKVIRLSRDKSKAGNRSEYLKQLFNGVTNCVSCKKALGYPIGKATEDPCICKTLIDPNTKKPILFSKYGGLSVYEVEGNDYVQESSDELEDSSDELEEIDEDLF